MRTGLPRQAVPGRRRAAAAACGLVALVIGPQAVAAPLDAFLQAQHPTAPRELEFDLGYDMANRTVDVLGLRPKKADGTYGPSGDYRGGHLRLGTNLAPAWWVEGGLWRRELQYVSVASQVTSWQLATQYRWLDGGDTGLSLALRAGAWGSAAPQMRKNTKVKVEGITFTSATATQPSDRQLQVDLVATWPLRPNLRVSAFVGGGTSQVDMEAVSATTDAKEGCAFDVQFTDEQVIATCLKPGAEVRIAVPNAVYGIDINREARYHATFATAGAHTAWTTGPWALRAGVQAIAMQRGAVDTIVQRRGGTPHRVNALVVAQAGYRLRPRTEAYVRAQVMAHQFVGELPMNYNSLTATQHRRHYGFLTLGLAGSF